MHLEELPHGVMMLLFAKFPVRDQCPLQLVNREWRNTLRHNAAAGALDIRDLSSSFTQQAIRDLCKRHRGADGLLAGEFLSGKLRLRTLTACEVLDIVEESQMTRLRNVELQGSWSHKHGVIGIFSRAYALLQSLPVPSASVQGCWQLSGITRVVLGHAEAIDDKLLAELVERLPRLSELYTRPAAASQVSDSGMRALGGRSLRFLALESDRITDDGVAAALAGGCMEHLYLHGCSLTSAVFSVIAERCKSLKTLELPSSVLYPTNAVDAILAIATARPLDLCANKQYTQLMHSQPDLNIRFV